MDKPKIVYLFIWCVLLISIVSLSASAQDRFIDCRKFASTITIVIDGDGKDWPVASFGKPAGIETGGLVVTGDHFVLDPDTASYDNQETNNLYTGPEDISATTHIGWNDSAFYILNMARDSQIGFEHARANTVDADGYMTGQSTGWTSDGIELWFDFDNDRLPPNIETDQTSLYDCQFDVLIDDALQRRDFPDIPEQDIGIRQDNFNYQYKEFFRSGAAYNDGADQEFEMLTKIQTATKIDADNKGYSMEIRIPFGEIEMFDPSHPIGINISWLDWDNGEFSHRVWNGEVAELTEEYKEMRFTSDRPLGAAPVGDWPVF